MSANPNTLMIPINEYVALQTELSILKVQYEALQAQVNQKQLGIIAKILFKSLHPKRNEPSDSAKAERTMNNRYSAGASL